MSFSTEDFEFTDFLLIPLWDDPLDLDILIQPDAGSYSLIIGTDTTVYFSSIVGEQE